MLTSNGSSDLRSALNTARHVVLVVASLEREKLIFDFSYSKYLVVLVVVLSVRACLLDSHALEASVEQRLL